MPSPVGHALSGLLVAGLVSVVAGPGGAVDPAVRRRLAGCAMVAAVVPDLDLLFATHRAASHSFVMAGAVGILAFAVLRIRGLRWAGMAGWACGLAWALHVGLDWLGRDTSVPRGVMALWPFSTSYLISGLDVFADISRRYWKPEEFVWGNLRAIAWELLLLLPPTCAALWAARRRPAQ